MILQWLKNLFGGSESSLADDPNFRDDPNFKRALAAIKAAELLKLGVRECFQNEDGDDLFDFENVPVVDALVRYKDEMAGALSTITHGEDDAAFRDGRIYAARRALVAVVPVQLTPEMVLGIDRKLGLPPIDPVLGLPSQPFPPRKRQNRPEEPSD